MKNTYTLSFVKEIFPVILLNGEISKGWSKIPKKIIQEIADKNDLYLYGETSMITGKHVYKAGKKINDAGGVVNLFSSESKSTFYEFVYFYSYNLHNRKLNMA